MADPMRVVLDPFHLCQSGYGSSGFRYRNSHHKENAYPDRPVSHADFHSRVAQVDGFSVCWPIARQMEIIAHHGVAYGCSIRETDVEPMLFCLATHSGHRIVDVFIEHVL